MRCRAQRMNPMIRLGRKRKYTEKMKDLNNQPPRKRPRLDEMERLKRKRKYPEEMDDLDGQPPRKRPRLDEMVRLGRKRKYTAEMDDLDNQPSNKHQKVDDAQMNLDPLTKFLRTIRAWVDVNKMVAIWCRHPPTALAQGIRVEPEKSNVQATDRCPPTTSVRTIEVRNKMIHVQVMNRRPLIKENGGRPSRDSLRRMVFSRVGVEGNDCGLNHR